MLATWEAIFGVLLVGLFIVLCTAFVYFTQIYLLCPGWGPIRHFDSDAESCAKIGGFKPSENIMPAELEISKEYGTLGPSTWGTIQAPWERREKQWHPTYGEIDLRPGFCDTQKLRAESSWWARDEPYYLAKTNTQLRPLQINEEFDATHRMV
eukprot:TRINITY_DN50160_c0_g1_i1.p1 TRINITY_DN50160_c0_g1~~TRINITY_DN50160_c0_g1_i1.p1  ORF type:complete len:153 (-),score=17.22 TRINITY_DN50160_c0_g1_i1:19-477(-)